MAPFPHLASPVSLGPVELRNRVALLPHGLFFADQADLLPTERHVAYYRARAEGGAALVCTESSVVSHDGRQGAPLVISSDPRCIPGYRRIAEAVHAAGARVHGQLTHYGNQASSSVIGGPVLGPSRLPDAALREPAQPLTHDDMARIRGDFVAGALSFAEAGFDVVELKLAHDGLLRQFLSPLTNDRPDEYGGSLANRLRYPLEVAGAVRAAVGRDVALGVRLVLDECIPGGYDLDEGIAIAQDLAASGLLDYISADVGIWASVHMVTPPMAIPEGYGEEAFARCAAAVELPVIAFGRIQTPAYAEEVIAAGKAAVVGLARQHLADPDWARKTFAGTPERIRPCTYCNQLCVGNGMKLLPVGCTVNPLVGFGERLPEPSGATRTVVVAGGGPAGLEAARVAAEDGARVVLFEPGELGGRLALASRTGGRELWGRYVAWSVRELERLGVELRRIVADEELVRAEQPDTVVLAVGSTATQPGLTGPGVVDLDAFLRDASLGPGARVALVDEGAAGMPLWTAALEAAHRGAVEVTVVTPLPVVAGDTDGATFLALYGELNARDVRFATDSVATALAGGRLELANVYGGHAAHAETDVVVCSTTRAPAGTELAEALADLAPRVVGDALVPRDAAAAIREGARAAFADPNERSPR